jgi:hypothetical protein
VNPEPTPTVGAAASTVSQHTTTQPACDGVTLVAVCVVLAVTWLPAGVLSSAEVVAAPENSARAMDGKEPAEAAKLTVVDPALWFIE